MSEDELITFGTVRCRPSVENAFRKHLTDGVWEATVAGGIWTVVYERAKEGTIAPGDEVEISFRKVVWMQVGNSDIVTIAPKNERRYSLDFRVCLGPEGNEYAYVHALWLDGADERPQVG
jgi:hypothetical protein